MSFFSGDVNVETESTYRLNRSKQITRQYRRAVLSCRRLAVPCEVN